MGDVVKLCLKIIFLLQMFTTASLLPGLCSICCQPSSTYQNFHGEIEVSNFIICNVGIAALRYRKKYMEYDLQNIEIFFKC